MPTHVRSYSKINLGLAIGPPRPDGFHGLCTLYQTLALHDVLSVVARPARQTLITLRSNDRRVPLDARNTVWKMVERVLAHTHRSAEVTVYLQKNLPIQGGMGAGSANAAAALLGMERQLDLHLGEEERMRMAAEVGSDVPLFLVGGAVLGGDRGQLVAAAPEVTLDGSGEIACVIALPGIGVSTPQAFRDWDTLLAGGEPGCSPDLHIPPVRDTMEMLSQTYASVFLRRKQTASPDTSGINSAPGFSAKESSPENQQGAFCEQLHTSPEAREDKGGSRDDLAETLLALVRTGIENDFEKVVFPQYPALQAIKRTMMGDSDRNPDKESSAVYAALSGSGSAVFGLFRSEVHAQAAQQRLQHDGVEALVTRTLPRPLYWSTMFAE